MKKSKLWHTLEALADGAVIAEWALELGDEFERVRLFLQDTADEAKTFPCLKRIPCECRRHRLEPVRRGEKVFKMSVCDCGECKPVLLKLTRLILHELNRPRLADAVTRLCGWRKTPTDLILPGVWQLGTWNDLRANLYWCAGGRADRVRRMVDSLFAIDSSPFILVLPTRANLTPSLDAALKREGCCALPLEEHLTIESTGTLKLEQSIDGIREEFEDRAATRRDVGKVLRGIYERFGEFGAEHRELRRTKERLETMLAEGMFAFTKQVDARAFKVICTILAQGDVAKASRELNMSDTALRDEIKSWKGRGKVYETLADLVRWRKVVGRSHEIPLNDSILLEKTKNVDHPALLSDVLDELLSMTEGNWADKAEDLAERLRPHVPR